ncbi:DsbA family protein [Paraburkholderia sp. Tr-20389]|uniref:DsbA family protein n=1 Tax=Paraburkholderia sp. Tr-20389 TaxID=2703903 RepID=UPI001981190D|nr:DsbA family protein [Paraburkholderia sp. Tr-20389]MBN3753640.1 DsbA family protein [Paraburkholderia sp. Tr-20389]
MKLIFVGDPMCSWCYGFGKEMSAIAQSMPDLEVQVVVGGMAAGSTQVLDDAAKQFRLTHWARVEQMSGAVFNRDALMARKNFVYDTEPVCRAVVSARTVAPNVDVLKVFRAFQLAFYVDGLDTTDGNVLAEIGARAIAEQGIATTANAFFEAFTSDEVIDATQRDFELTRRLGVRGFPSLFVEIDGKIGQLSSGYTTAAQVTQALKPLAA